MPAIVTPVAAAAAAAARKVEARDRMARLDEIGGHRTAHVAEAEERNIGHGS